MVRPGFSSIARCSRKPPPRSSCGCCCEGNGGSRIAWATAALGLLYAWRPAIGIWIKLFPIAIVTVLAVAALLVLGEAKLHSGANRIILWGATAMAITPLGQGLGWFYAAHPAQEYAHSDVLQAFAELGVGGFVLVAVPFACWIGSKRERAVKAVFCVICGAVLLSFPLHLPASGFLAALVAGFMAGDRPSLRDDGFNGRAEDDEALRWERAVAYGGMVDSKLRDRHFPLRSTTSSDPRIFEESY